MKRLILTSKNTTSVKIDKNITYKMKVEKL